MLRREFLLKVKYDGWVFAKTIIGAQHPDIIKCQEFAGFFGLKVISKSGRELVAFNRKAEYAVAMIDRCRKRNYLVIQFKITARQLDRQERHFQERIAAGCDA